jgi:hypothetical protein
MSENINRKEGEEGVLVINVRVAADGLQGVIVCKGCGSAQVSAAT